ncbi:MAG: calcium-binding EGF-like domain-containing protein, partial [Pseudomonadota bacterium]
MTPIPPTPITGVDSSVSGSGGSGSGMFSASGSGQSGSGDMQSGTSESGVSSGSGSVFASGSGSGLSPVLNDSPCGRFASCVNVIGSFRCDCPAGFVPAANGL